MRHLAAEHGVSAEARRSSDGYAEIALSVGSGGDKSRSALLITNGVEMFNLELDGRFDVREFDWEPEGQRQSLAALVGVAAAHLRGESTAIRQPRRFRHQDREGLEVRWQGESYRAWA